MHLPFSRLHRDNEIPGVVGDRLPVQDLGDDAIASWIRLANATGIRFAKAPERHGTHLAACARCVSGILVAGWIGWDETRRPQPMWIMNVVWPVAALFGTVLVWGYLKFGRSASESAAKSRRRTPDTCSGVLPRYVA
ncbi:hypothetical protein LB526_15985 [Mesorhizobium sp. CA6]|uniref:hypothetical protein n=1 Tax=Mesorhizobium sp. CA6 TaxID=588500 RepID=UPI001CCC172D|nr:hypothetical protein [Mesorhizobium sp. CA6]MBZ9768258.1 hypothetical protein [Mesorhizobium sp. CA6]